MGIAWRVMASVEINQMLAAAAAACDEKKAEDIRILALDPTESGLTDYFLICTGSNDRQTVAITDEIELRLKREFGTYPNSVEGRRQGEWILMDYVDFIVHVFLPEKRAYYGLERLRPSATSLSIAELNTEITSAIAAQRSGKGAKRAAKLPEVAPSSAKATTKKVASKTTAGANVVPRKSAAKAAAKSPAKRAAAAVKKAGKKSASKAAKRAPASRRAS